MNTNGEWSRFVFFAKWMLLVNVDWWNIKWPLEDLIYFVWPRMTWRIRVTSYDLKWCHRIFKIEIRLKWLKLTLDDLKWVIGSELEAGETFQQWLYYRISIFSATPILYFQQNHHITGKWCSSRWWMSHINESSIERLFRRLKIWISKQQTSHVNLF